MFWTDALVQKGLFGEDHIEVSSSITRLVKFAEEAFPDCDSNFHRTVAFLTHNETQSFLRPMLVARFGSVDAAKLPTIDWLESVGSFETLARSTRNGAGAIGPSGLAGKKRGVPEWYEKYLKTSRFADMKRRAESFWTEFMGGTIHCSVNARHSVECWHHSDYGRLGEGDEFRFLIPLCHACHASVTGRGPNLPSATPEGVKQWI
jgi:hypothetical protein